MTYRRARDVELTLSSIDEFIEKHGITAFVSRVDIRPGYVLEREPFTKYERFLIPTPSEDEEGWKHYAWSVSLNRGTPGVDHQGLSVPFRTGIGHVERKGRGWYDGTSWPKKEPTEPKLRDVLDCMSSYSAGYENTRDFAEWCGEYGYDTDSRKAEKTHRQVVEQAHALQIFLGREGYEELLWEVESL